MIYSQGVKFNDRIITVFMNALAYLDYSDLTEIELYEAIKYVEQDIRFLASARIPDKFFVTGHVKFHYTDQ